MQRGAHNRTCRAERRHEYEPVLHHALAQFSVNSGSLVFEHAIIDANGRVIAGDAAQAPRIQFPDNLENNRKQSIMTKILILAANPQNTDRLRLDEEIREIEQGLQRAKLREQFEWKSVLAVRPDDLRRALLDFHPHIVHFSGHGSEQGIKLENPQGRAQTVNTEALAGLFKLFSDEIECVVLNACYTEIQAQAIAQHIAYVAGMQGSINSHAALKFAIGFYDALGAGENVERAFAFGENAVSLEGLDGNHRPQIFRKVDILQLPVKQSLMNQSMISDWQASFDLLMQDLDRGAEEKGEKKGFTRQSVLQRLQQIGKYLTEHKTHHQEWGVSIRPLENQEIESPEALREAFYEGIAATWKHISAGLDIVRNHHLQAIEAGFKKNNIVIVHGASGQGKSALAYRYMHDYCSAAARYEIRDLTTAKRALELVTAIAGYKIPLTFYCDVNHKDKGLPEFLRHAAEFPHIRCLVTIREEDWRLTGLTSADLKFTDLELSFDQTEAKELYTAWERDKGSHFPDFEQAWAKFNETGPLLEFVHLLTHTESLHERLRQQYEQIADAINCNRRSEHDRELLEYVAVAGACGTRIDLTRLKKIPPASLKRSIKRLEKEYLLRRSDDQRYLSALHPIRAEILAAIVTEPVIRPWAELALECLPLLADTDIEIFLLHGFVSHPEASEVVLAYLNSASMPSWTAAGGVARALLWKGVHGYVYENRELLEQIHKQSGNAWLLMLDLDFLGLLETASARSSFLELLPEQGKAQAEFWRKQQTPKECVFDNIEIWLKQAAFPVISSCKTETDWQALGQTSYWTGFRKLETALTDNQDWTVLDRAVDTIPLESLADLIYGLWHTFSHTKAFSQWYNKTRPKLMQRYREETLTPCLEEQQTTLRAHFVVPLEEKDAQKPGEKNRLNRLAMEHVMLLCRLIPEYSIYACQGYGHKLFDFMEYDETVKNITTKTVLTPGWIKQINWIGNTLSGHFFRPKTWKDYCGQMLDLRQNAIHCMDELRKNLSKHFRSKKVIRQLGVISDSENWKLLDSQLVKQPEFPLDAIDRWGLAKEGNSTRTFSSNSDEKQQQKIVSAYLQRYRKYLKSKSDYLHGLSTFMRNAKDILIANVHLGKTKTPQQHLAVQQRIQALKLNLDRPFLAGCCLADALKSLSDFQYFYRWHFGKLSDLKQLSRLEQQEKQTLHAVWCLWFFFAAAPTRHWDMPERAALAQLDSRMRAMRKNIEQALRQLSTDTLQFCCLGDTQPFEDKPALWISINGQNPIDVYFQTEPLFAQLKEALGEIKLHSIEYCAFEFQWEHLVIVPLCRGKLLDAHVWVIPNSKLTQNAGLSQVNRIPQQIEAAILACLGLEVWQPAFLNDAWLFLQGAATLQIRLRHLVEITKLPDLDETGTAIAKSYINSLQDVIGKDAQQLIDASKKLKMLGKQVEETSEIPLAVTKYLQPALEQLYEIDWKFIPEGLEDNQVNLTMEALKKWQEQVASVQGEVFIIYLLWCGYLIDKLAS